MDTSNKKYYEVATRSHSGKSLGYNYFWAKNLKEAKEIMKKKRLPIYSIKICKY